MEYRENKEDTQEEGVRIINNGFTKVYTFSANWRRKYWNGVSNWHKEFDND